VRSPIQSWESSHGSPLRRERNSRRPILQKKRVTEAKELAGFGGRDTGVGGEAVVMIEALGGGPGRKLRATEIAETFLEAGDIGSRMRVARWNGAARARIAAFEGHIANAEADHAAFVFRKELVFPESRDFIRCDHKTVNALCGGRAVTIDFERGAEPPARFFESHTGKPFADCLQRRSGDNRWAGGQTIIGKTLAGVADDDLLFKVGAEPFRSLLGIPGKCECGGKHVAAVSQSRERDAAEIRRIGRADAMNSRSAFGVNPAPVSGIERPGTVEFEAAIGADAGFGHLDGVERLDGVKLDACEARCLGFRFHTKSLAETTAVHYEWSEKRCQYVLENKGTQKKLRQNEISLDRALESGILARIEKCASAMPGRFAF
jgi:hypothetical protein